MALHAFKKAREYTLALAFLTVIVGLLPILLCAFLTYVLWSLGRRIVLLSWFWYMHGKQGRVILFVYSESPLWKNYLEQRILPRLGPHVVTLNWSRRKRWRDESPWEARLFYEFTGTKEYNPIAIVFRRPWSVVTIPFYLAFHETRKGNEQPLRKIEEELFQHLDEIA